jgi:hypothetical protein
MCSAAAARPRIRKNVQKKKKKKKKKRLPSRSWGPKRLFRRQPKKILGICAVGGRLLLQI